MVVEISKKPVRLRCAFTLKIDYLSPRPITKDLGSFYNIIKGIIFYFN